MFLILGTSKCQYCDKAKSFLNDNNLNYHYVDLILELGDHWRSIFKALDKVIQQQKTIPLVFLEKNPCGDAPSVPDLHPTYLMEHYDFLGDYNKLQDYVDNLDITIDNNY